MKITARRQPTVRQHTEHDTDFSTENSSFSTILEEDQPPHPKQRQDPDGPRPYPSNPITPDVDHDALQNQRRVQAQRELQLITDEDPESDPYAEDARGIALLLQAAQVIEDRDRAQIMLQERTPQLDGTLDDSEGGIKNTFEAEPPTDTTPPAQAQMSTRSSSRQTASLLQDPRNYERRRSSRIASMKSAPKSYPRSTRATGRSKSEQPKTTKSQQQLKSRPKTSVAETAPAPESSDPDAIVRQRIQAIYDKETARLKGKRKRLADWDPVVRDHLKEQGAKAGEDKGVA